jgi:hypothetical protein
MKYRSFRYTLKVWLTSVAIAPIMYLFITFYLVKNQGSISQGSFVENVSQWPFFSIMEMIFSIPTWLVFFFIILMTTRSGVELVTMRLISCLSGISLTVISFWLVFFRGLFDPSDVLFCLMLCNCFCIGWGALYYNLERSPA